MQKIFLGQRRGVLRERRQKLELMLCAYLDYRRRFSGGASPLVYFLRK